MFLGGALLSYVVADRTQPALLRVTRVRRDRVWVRGAREAVRVRFPDCPGDPARPR